MRPGTPALNRPGVSGRLTCCELCQFTQRWPGRVTTPIREAVAARDAYTAGLPVSRYAPGSGIATDYAAALATSINAQEQ